MGSPQEQLRLVPPYTVYSVALVFFHKKRDGRTAVASRPVVVSGVNPLTGEEARARAEATVRDPDYWGKLFKPATKSEDYDCVLWHVATTTIGG